MRIERFAVRGYKNLVEQVVLDDLGDVNVIHGDNSVGKSNLMEAIDLAFRMLRWGNATQTADFAHQNLGVTSLADLFNLDRPLPIEIEVRLAVDEADFTASGVPWEPRFARLDLSLRLEFDLQGRYSNSVSGVDAKGEKLTSEFFARCSNVWSRRTPATLLGSWFEIIGLSRRTLGTPHVTDDRDIIPPDVCLALFEASNSDDASLLRRWRAFVGAVKHLGGPLAVEEIRALYGPKQVRARLSVGRGDGRVPSRLLGAGVQHALAVLGWLAARHVDIVAIEEPEVGLRYSNQIRLADAIRALVEAGAPKQVFVVSHSPAFETPGQHFYAMKAGPNGPTVTRRPAEVAASFVDMAGLQMSPTGHVGAPCYVTSEGLALIPERVRVHLGIPDGGGVVFETLEADVASMMSSETWADREGLVSDVTP